MVPQGGPPIEPTPPDQDRAFFTLPSDGQVDFDVFFFFFFFLPFFFEQRPLLLLPFYPKHHVSFARPGNIPLRLPPPTAFGRFFPCSLKVHVFGRLDACSPPGERFSFPWRGFLPPTSPISPFFRSRPPCTLETPSAVSADPFFYLWTCDDFPEIRFSISNLPLYATVGCLNPPPGFFSPVNPLPIPEFDCPIDSLDLRIRGFF